LRSGERVQEGAAATDVRIRYSTDEIIDTGHHFFGGISKGIALVVEKAANQWGQPNGYILGEEAGGAFIGGLRYGCSRPRSRIAVARRRRAIGDASGSCFEAPAAQAPGIMHETALRDEGSGAN
jgi:Envelope integrity protein A